MMVNLPCLKGSCPNFLRPTYSYTECQLSFLTGSCPTERTSANYSSYLYLISTDLTISFSQGTDIQWTLSLMFFVVGLLDDIVFDTLHCFRVSFLQNPARFQIPLEPSKSLELQYVFCRIFITMLVMLLV